MAEKEKEILEGQAQEAANQTDAEDTAAEAEAADAVNGAEQEAEAAEEAEDTEAESKKLFGKGRKKDKDKDALKEKVEELEDRVKRQMAEFENFRKRTEKEKSAMYEVGAKSVIEKMLPVVDNFERGLAAIPEGEKGNAFYEGMNMIYKQLMGELDKLGVAPIEAVGCEFDPNLHNAVMQVESEEFESGIIAQELQKGYTYHDTVVRHSMVAVVS